MIPKNRRFSFILVLLMCLTLCLTALCEGDTEEVSITIFDENGEVILGETPEPEVTPEEALAGGAKIIGTGRSDYPNQWGGARTV